MSITTCAIEWREVCLLGVRHDYKKEANTAGPSIERRLAKRTRLDCEVKYSLDSSLDRVSTGLLEDASATGVLVWTDDEIPTGTLLQITIEPEYDEEESAILVVRIVRRDNRRGPRPFGYGCVLMATDAL